VHQLEGTVKNDQGLIEGVKVQLIYTRITAPVSGRSGCAWSIQGTSCKRLTPTGWL
jgi:hypothetical protein